jgi:hypothetical protein
MGSIQLEVLFGEKDNFHHEPVWFEVLDLNNPYHALLGRPALAKFMAVPHYAYLNMKFPGPHGVCREDEYLGRPRAEPSAG